MESNIKIAHDRVGKIANARRKLFHPFSRLAFCKLGVPERTQVEHPTSVRVEAIVGWLRMGWRAFCRSGQPTKETRKVTPQVAHEIHYPTCPRRSPWNHPSIINVQGKCLPDGLRKCY